MAHYEKHVEYHFNINGKKIGVSEIYNYPGEPLEAEVYCLRRNGQEDTHIRETVVLSRDFGGWWKWESLDEHNGFIEHWGHMEAREILGYLNTYKHPGL